MENKDIIDIFISTNEDIDREIFNNTNDSKIKNIQRKLVMILLMVKKEKNLILILMMIIYQIGVLVKRVF